MTDGLQELRKAEHERRALIWKERRAFLLTLLPIGAGMGLCALYLTLPVLVAAGDPYYRPAKPDPWTFFQAAAAPLLGGIAVAVATGLLVNELAGSWPAWARFLLAGILFGALVQFAIGLLMPVNRLFLDAAEGQVGGVVSDRIIDAVYGTPLFAATYGTRGIGIGMVAGAVYAAVGLTAWQAQKLVVPLGRTVHPAGVSTFLTFGLCLAVFVGPAALFQWLVSAFDGR